LFSNKPLIIIIFGFAVAVALVMTRPKEARSVASEKAWSVETLPVQRASLSPALELFGSVLSPQDAQLSSGLDGEVMELLVLDGQAVEAGQTLLRLDGRDARLTLAEREAELKDLDAQLRLTRTRLKRNRQALEREQELLVITQSKAARAQELFKDRLISESDVETTSENLKRQELAVSASELDVQENRLNIEQLEAQLSSARAQRDRAQLDVERSVITAPFPGVISELQVSVGDRVRDGDPLMRLQNPAAIEVRAQVPSRYAESISTGLARDGAVPARINVDGRLVNGAVVRLSGQTREGSGGVDSFIRLDDNEIGLRLGATVRVLLDLPQVDGVIGVPAEALYGRDRIYRIVDDRMQMVAVERVGERLRQDGKTEVIVRSPVLQDGDQIIVTKLSNAVDGLLVAPTAVDPTAFVNRPAGDPAATAAPSIAAASSGS
jgi:RND family efflux transporter MFP subunit